MNFPQANFEGKGFREVGRILEGGESFEIAEIFAPGDAEGFEFAAKGKFEASVVEGDAHAFGFADKTADGLNVERIFGKSAANIGVDGEFGGNFETLDRRKAEADDETHERSAIFVDLAVGRFGFLECGFENDVENFALFVAEEEFESEIFGAEFEIENANQLDKFAAFESGDNFFSGGAVGLVADENAHAASDFVIAESGETIGNMGRFASYVGSDFGLTNGDARFSGGENLSFEALDVVAVNVSRRIVTFVEGADAIVRADLDEVELHGNDVLFPDAAAIAYLGDVAFRERELIDELKFDIFL